MGNILEIMKRICVIPARMGSSRFPGKPLIKINGCELIHHVYKNCTKCKIFNEVIIATPDKEILDFGKTIDATTIITSNEHERASDRVNEVLLRLEEAENQINTITMVQGDEPL